MKRIALACTMLLVGPGTSLAADSDEMAKVVGGFYAAYSTFHPSDGIPDAKARAKYEPSISPALDALLKKGDAAEDKFAKANKDSPPLLEGDLFTSNFEGATAFRIGACAGDAKAGHCAVTLTYDPGKTNNPKDKPFTWTDTAYLVNTPGGWRVDDIGYGGTWDFGNKGKMTDTLRSVIRDSSE
ncbi:MAG TPA: hypothetical protein VMF58_09600 [Rhizomicrobium sp.]|nr:hypothetical protein [Rhizomicrobium sp.]